ncbi:F-box only protein 27 [Camelus ferus]|uniref:F-box only protein 27 n=1 Tax=Camelus ferus TaxID=419612 RepID=A0A8B8TI94_CAMFR|nr:F-box only protein 27 [Camelus ferus]
MQGAPRPGEEPIRASASRGRPAPQPEPEEALGLSQLPPELLLAVLSLLPPRTLLGRCRQVCRRWRALVDAPGLWLKILARDHRALWPVVRSCLPRADAASACLLGRFCARGPIGRNLFQNPKGTDGFQMWTMLSGGDGWAEEENYEVLPGAPSQTSFPSTCRWCHKKETLDLEAEGLWPELLDSGKVEIRVSHWWADRQGTDCMYQLTVQLLDANKAVLDHVSPVFSHSAA